jgi:drug/metabolite transporter (DMT)-like permease
VRRTAEISVAKMRHNTQHGSDWDKSVVKKSIILDLALLLILATLWGASYSLIKIGVSTIPPITFIATRTLLAGAILLGILHLRGLRLPTDKVTWKRFAFQACINTVFPFTMIAWAEQSVDAGLATILNSTTPIFTFIFMFFITQHEAISARKLFGVIAGSIGICLIVGVEALSGLGRDLWAQLAIVAATACYGVASIFGRGFKDLDPMMPAAGSLISGAVILLPLSLLVDQPWALTPSMQSILALLGLSVFSTAVAFVIYFRLLSTLGSVGTTAQAFLRVPIGVAIAMIFLKEVPTPTMLIGLVCVIVGVAAMTIPRQSALVS